MSRLTLKNLNKKEICILGLGIENYALVKYLIKKKISCNITICDARKKVKNIYPDLKTKNIKWNLGKDYDKNLVQYDIIFRIAGYPLFSKRLKEAKKLGVIITSPVKLFFDWCPTKNIIGVTGTKGKGTTSSLIYSILKKAGKKVYFGGNIGYPMFNFLDKIKKNDWVVLELSSFQLEDLEKSPKISVITNFAKEHLAPADPNNPNYHHSLSDYWNAKLNIALHQKKGDKLIINNNLKNKIKNYPLASKVIYFKKSKIPTQLPGEHNKENIATAIEVVKILKIKKDKILESVKNFKGLPHRLELVSIIRGIKYYDDSFATTPEAGITAIKSFSDPIILLVGGADKGSNFKQFAKEIKKRVKFVVLLDGKATPKIKKELLAINYPKNKMAPAYNMRQAIIIANSQAEKGDVVLLAPACASFGMFQNYKERGDKFKIQVKKLK